MTINRDKVIDDLSQIEITGADNGLIDGYNVFVTQLPANFCNMHAKPES